MAVQAVSAIKDGHDLLAPAVQNPMIHLKNYFWFVVRQASGSPEKWNYDLLLVRLFDKSIMEKDQGYRD